MTLTQKRFLLGSVDFEIKDEAVSIRTKRFMNETSREVPFRILDPTPSYHRSAPIPWLIFTLVFGSVTLVTLLGMIHDSWVPDKSGFIGTFLILLSATLGCGLVFYRRKVDFIILHAEGSGTPVIFIHRKLPTEIHVKEFIAIIQERILALRSASGLGESLS
jgi:hypothetical protein